MTFRLIPGVVIVCAAGPLFPAATTTTYPASHAASTPRTSAESSLIPFGVKEPTDILIIRIPYWLPFWRTRRHTLIASRRRHAAAGNHPCHMRSMPIVIIRLLFFLKEIPKSVNAIFQIRMQKYPCVQDRHPNAFSCQSSSVRLIAMNPFSRPVHRKKPPYSSLTVRIWGLSPYVNAASYLWKL